SGRDYPTRPARTGRSKQLHRVPRRLACPHGDRADLRPPRQRGHTPLLRRITIRLARLFRATPKTQRDTVAAGDGLATRSARVSWGLLWCSITNGYRDCAWALNDARRSCGIPINVLNESRYSPCPFAISCLTFSKLNAMKAFTF